MGKIKHRVRNSKQNSRQPALVIPHNIPPVHLDRGSNFNITLVLPRNHISLMFARFRNSLTKNLWSIFPHCHENTKWIKYCEVFGTWKGNHTLFWCPPLAAIGDHVYPRTVGVENSISGATAWGDTKKEMVDAAKH